MKRLRHPIRAIREPFGTAGLVVACVALVLALTGAAFAAGGLTGKQKKEVEKIAKKYAGKPGAPGAAGSAGPQGPAGAAGKDGTNGSPGSPGEKGPTGATGAAGRSVEIVDEFTAGGPGCNENGGVAYEVEGEPSSKTEICNGKEGKDGKEGSPWTLGGTLPPGKTETGSWGGAAASGEVIAPISFAIPLKQTLSASHVHLQGEATFDSFCHANADAPIGGTGTKAPAPGELCVYEGGGYEGLIEEPYPAIFAPNFITKGASNAGGFVIFEVENTGGHWGGSFAVTGCDPVPTNPFPCP